MRRRRRSNRGFQARCPGSGILCGLVRNGLLFLGGFRVGHSAKVFAHFDGCGYLDRTRVRLFLGNAGVGQIVNDGLRFDLELASQFVDSDLIRIGHCPPGPLPVSFILAGILIG
jgi:hypothetical protein